MKLDTGLVFMSDTRTNSGVDNISTFRKMHSFEKPGERHITILSAGNLATTQSVISLLAERTKAPEDRNPSILAAASMFQVAQIIGDLLRETIRTREQTGLNAETTFNATLIVGGQIKGMEPRLFMIYPEGNFIEASEDTPFFQIGETKYGRPILVRGFQSDMSFESAVKLLMVSFDSTMAANLSVALPLDMLLLPKDRFEPLQKRRITEDDPYFSTISSKWSDALRTAFHSLPDYVID
ncbi:peptidase [Sphingorhabdus buctiana]|uniref:Peptidase n=1 Tax=Sphingorhabdus buctiana TaxID=1508805 RepID=A0ABW4MF50_9SPHN